MKVLLPNCGFFDRLLPVNAVIGADPVVMLIFGIAEVYPKCPVRPLLPVLVILFNSAYGVMNARQKPPDGHKIMGIPHGIFSGKASADGRFGANVQRRLAYWLSIAPRRRDRLAPRLKTGLGIGSSIRNGF